jgi:hypothetical protein
MSVSRSLQRLQEALKKAGLRDPAPASNEAAIAAFNTALSPWRLPSGLVAYWSAVDGPTLPVRIEFLEPQGPSAAIEFWEDMTELHQPMNVALLAYENQWCAAVQLDTDQAVGGTIWSWYLVDGGFDLLARSVGEWLDIQAELVEQGAFSIRGSGWREDLYDAAYIERDAYRARLARRLGLASADDIPTIGRDPAVWPAHWAIDKPA